MSSLENDEPCLPLTFARDVLRVKLWSKQEKVLIALSTRQRMAAKSGNGLGKGFCAAVATLWFLYSHDPAIVLSTTPTFRQVRHILWRQIRRLHCSATQTLGYPDLSVEFDLSAIEALQEDENSRVGREAQLLDRGVLTINEVRRQRNLPDVPWGDT